MWWALAVVGTVQAADYPQAVFDRSVWTLRSEESRNLYRIPSLPGTCHVSALVEFDGNLPQGQALRA